MIDRDLLKAVFGFNAQGMGQWTYALGLLMLYVIRKIATKPSVEMSTTSAMIAKLKSGSNT